MTCLMVEGNSSKYGLKQQISKIAIQLFMICSIALCNSKCSDLQESRWTVYFKEGLIWENKSLQNPFIQILQGFVWKLSGDSYLRRNLGTKNLLPSPLPLHTSRGTWEVLGCCHIFLHLHLPCPDANKHNVVGESGTILHAEALHYHCCGGSICVRFSHARK